MKKDDCIFCRIANGEIPSTTVYEDADFCVILDLNPAMPGHALIIPKEHSDDVCQLDTVTAQKVLPLAARIGSAQKAALHCDGFHLVQNNGEAAGQTVKHFHMHVIPRYRNKATGIVMWEPGIASEEERESLGTAIRAAIQ